MSAGLVPHVPVSPPTASLQQNVTQAQQHGSYWVTFDQVPNKHPWDYKQQGAQYQDFGNFNYGVTSGCRNARGRCPTRRRLGSAKSRHVPVQLGNPWDVNGGPYGDDPNDQAQIKAGYDYYNSGLYRLWSQ